MPHHTDTILRPPTLVERAYAGRDPRGLGRRSGSPRGGGRRRAGFSPRDLDPDLLLLEDTGIALDDSDRVQAWEDPVKGITFSQATEDNRPAYNASDANWGTAALSFDGTNDRLLSGDVLDLPSSSDLTIISGARDAADDTSRHIIFSKYGGGPGYRFGITGSASIVRDADAFAAASADPAASTNFALRNEFTNSTGLHESFLDGTSADTSTESGLTDDSKDNAENAEIGASAGSLHWQGTITFVFLKFGLLTADELTQLSEWAADRYNGITAV